MRPKWCFVLVLAMAVAGVFAQALHGQVISGTITGFVTDPSGAAIPGATVTATNVLTGVATKRSTEATGIYSITNLIPGTYTVTVEATGFQKFVQENLILNVDSKLTVDAHLVVGAVTQELTVTAVAPLLKAEKADVSQILPERTIQELPTVGRNVTQLEFLAPGTVPYTFQQGPAENPSLGATATANGQFWGSNEFQIDGITDVEFGSTGMQIVNPPVDSVQEMKVTTSNYDAELGQVSGLVAEYVTKGGTNDFHGSLFWFNRNKATFAANPFSEKVPGTGPSGKGTGPAPFNWNNGGGSVGGPIKKNKMFFFADYQLNRTRQGSSALATVPTQAFQTGDLRAALGNYICSDGSTSASPCASPLMVPTTEGGTIAAQQNMVFDPTTGKPDGAGRSAFTVGGVPNMIPSTRFNPVSANLLNLLRQQLGGKFVDQSKTANNFAGSTGLLFDQDQVDGRYDWNISDNNKVFFRYTYFLALLNNPPLFGLAGGPAAGGLNAENAKYRNHLGSLTFTHSFSPTLLTEGRFGLVRFGLRAYQWDIGHNTNDQVGIKGINSSDPLTQGLAGFTISGPVGNWTMGLPSGPGIPRIQFNTIFQWANNWTWMHGNHQLRWGVDLRRQRFDFLTLNESSRGNFQFSQVITGEGGLSGTGLGMATFLLGLPSEYDRATFTQFPAERDTRFAWYVQDDWHVNPKLVLNLGMRYEYIGPSTPHFAGGGVNYNPDTGNLLLSGVGQVSRTANIKSDWNNFGPRVGFAYKLMTKTVVRGGFGRSYFSSNYGGGVFGTLCCNYPVQTRQDIPQVNQYFPIQDPNTGVPLSLDKPVPPPPPTEIPSSGLLPLPKGLGAFYTPFNNQTSYVDSWNFTIQNQLRPDIAITTSYVGNASRKLYGSWDINTPIPGPGDFNPRRPYHLNPGVDNDVSMRCHCINANYNALEFTVDKRFGSGYSILSSYTWAKSLDREFGGFGWGSQAQNPFDINASYGISENNRASVWTLAHVWHLPYGSGQKWGSSASGLQKAILGGWVFNGITTVMSGFPIGINWGDNSSLNSTFGQRPDAISSPAKNIPAGLWYNPAAFRNPGVRGLYLFGNYGRDPGDLRGPGWFTGDLALWKEFAFKTPLAKENTILQFRWENFNSFNKTNRDLPVNDALNPQAGQVFGLAPAANMRRMEFGLRLQF